MENKLTNGGNMSDNLKDNFLILARVLIGGSEVDVLCGSIGPDQLREDYILLNDCKDLKFELESGDILEVTTYSVPKVSLTSYAVGRVLKKEQPKAEPPKAEEPPKKRRGRPKKNIGEVLGD
jgi:malonyl CoA-acyl carrier protein transacylase